MWFVVLGQQQYRQRFDPFRGEQDETMKRLGKRYRVTHYVIADPLHVGLRDPNLM